MDHELVCGGCDAAKSGLQPRVFVSGLTQNGLALLPCTRIRPRINDDSDVTLSFGPLLHCRELIAVASRATRYH